MRCTLAIRHESVGEYWIWYVNKPTHGLDVRVAMEWRIDCIIPTKHGHSITSVVLTYKQKSITAKEIKIASCEPPSKIIFLRSFWHKTRVAYEEYYDSYHKTKQEYHMAIFIEYCTHNIAIVAYLLSYPFQTIPLLSLCWINWWMRIIRLWNLTFTTSVNMTCFISISELLTLHRVGAALISYCNTMDNLMSSVRLTRVACIYNKLICYCDQTMYITCADFLQFKLIHDNHQCDKKSTYILSW